ncbi:MAG: rhodanese-like domain-containing protein [Euryarchaeota archaeon]|jgi:rhodanese-related sulfurtransferase|nr:rhodanese-like domain-containing protein [Euryarchaeota archaeon]MBT3653718.1 rhodanese-like domain-containing protein [Euryarchaeota archaeon]MBT3757807.1 rhodanese-like domain-containing protein [Euryarchaeota archaeon]MBT4051119.1 rhodanese-like domain-containing protein [Euryarchaeota archaeon]MBT4347080.1 rhodanese-like domain-containing protein [Euryarchaeota archaeon]|tara:strand:+ start:1632 stop:2030 length:399 start_codon:yes stop_codon:yes gene_type:complete
MNKRLLAILLISTISLAGCTTDPMWSRADANEFSDLIENNQDAFLIDARTQTEWEDDGHIEGATLIPHNNIKAQADDLPDDKEILILVYCRSGSRSQTASQSLLDLGYTNVVDLDSGIYGWKDAGYSVIYGA